MTKEEFISIAEAAALAGKYPAGITVAQAALESAWGNSQLSQKANNYFGIKAHGDAESIAFPTTEVVIGRRSRYWRASQSIPTLRPPSPTATASSPSLPGTKMPAPMPPTPSSLYAR